MLFFTDRSLTNHLSPTKIHPRSFYVPGEYTPYNVANNSFSSIDLSIINSTFTAERQRKILNEYNDNDH